MKKSLFIAVLFASFGCIFSLTAQTNELPSLTALQDSLNAKFEVEKAEAIRLAGQLNLPVRLVDDNGRVSELMRFRNGIPVYYSTQNANGAEMIMTSDLYTGGSAGLELNGQGEFLGVWDGGAVRATHQEFEGRATQMDGATNIIDHATHVAGTMAAGGIDPDAKGMSYQASIHAYDWNNDNAEMLAAAAGGMQVSQHSYGAIAGWAEGSFSGTSGWHWFGDVSISEEEDYHFGFYESSAQTWDLVARSSPHYLVVRSAGNDRGYGPDPGTQHYYFDANTNEWVSSTATRQIDGGADGYDCMSYTALAKNILSVGSVNAAGNISAFSGWGPTDDGRVKPDIVAKGQPVFSSMALSDSSYSVMAGTSMSGPMVSGSIGLLLEHQQNLQPGQNLLSSTLKGLVIHTADDGISGAPGPDYRYGWGLMNTKDAAQLMTDNSNADGALIYESFLEPNDTIVLEFSPIGEGPMRATLVWTDMPGPLPDPALNPTDQILVNDLDMRIQDEDDVEFSPYILDPSNPASDATTGDNFRDNVEMIHIDAPDSSQVYTLRIHHKGSLEGGNQSFSLIVTGANIGGIPDYDISVSAILHPVENICGEVFTPEITIKNYGKEIIESATIYYFLNSDDPDSLLWTGSLAPLQFVSLELPEMMAPSGGNSFTAFTSMPNGMNDENPANDTMEIAFFVNGEVIFVDQNATGSENGLSWDDAFVFLQDALEIACSCPGGAQVWVAEGTYFPDDGASQTNNDRNASFQLCNNVELYGGFVGTEVNLDERDWAANETLLSGDINQSNNLSGNSYSIVNGSGVNSSAILDGFSLKFGFANGGGGTPNPNFRGGAIYVNNGSPKIRNCVLMNNAAGFGGAVYSINANPDFYRVTFDDNFANTAGGAIYSLSSELDLEECSFIENFANAAGGAILNEQSSGRIIDVDFTLNSANLGASIYNATSSPEVARCRFSGNLGGTGGGAIYNDDSSQPEIKNSLFSGNEAERGGAIYNKDQSSPLIYNSTFSGNNANFDGGALYNEMSSSPVITNSILWRNGVGGDTTLSSASVFNTSGSEPEFSFSIVANSNGSGSNWNSSIGSDGGFVFDANPLFVESINPASVPDTSGDFTLLECSEAIDAGDNSALMSPDSLDLAGDVRIFNATQSNVATVDLGAYEFQSNVILPDLTCLSITVLLGSDLPEALAVEDFYTTNASCPDWSLIQPLSDSLYFSCNSIGDSTVLFVVSNLTGNRVDSCTSEILIVDSLPPVAQCQDITVGLDGAGTAVIVADDIDNGSTDNCEVESLSLSESEFDCEDLGVQSLVLTVSDASGNGSTCTANVTVADNLPPVAQCQDITVGLDGLGFAGIVADDIDNGSSDNCGVESLGLSQSEFDCDDLGIQSVVLTVSDASGNESTCSASVTVEDPILPVAQCQDFTVGLDGLGFAVISGDDIDNGSSDNCGVESLSLSESEFDCEDIGVHPVILTVSDASGNESTCTANVTVADNLPPVAQCQDITVGLDGLGFAVIVADDIDNGSSDNCGVENLSLSQSEFDCDDLGIQSVVLTVSDASGNESTCSANVTVADNLPPVAQCQDITVGLDGLGFAVIVADDIDNGSSDNCGVESLSLSQSEFDCDDLGIQSVVLTVSDASGNESTCSAIVTVEDPILPVAQCQDITVGLDGAGFAVIVADDLDNGSTDNCGVESLSLSESEFDCEDIGVHPVILTVSDASGNESTCSANVTVADNLPPVAQCQDITVALDGSGFAVIVADDIDNGSSDNCGVESLSLSESEFDCEDIGSNAVALFVADENGNESSCSATVTVVDDSAPEIECLNSVSQQVLVPGDTSVFVTLAAVTATDNCGVSSIENDYNDGGADASDVYFLGTTSVVYTAFDISGNAGNCATEVIVVQDSSVIAVCIDITAELGQNGLAEINASDLDGGSFGGSGPLTFLVNGLPVLVLECSDTGPNPVTLTVVDEEGEQDECTANIQLVDLIAPVALCQDITIELDADGSASIVAQDVDGGSFDNCVQVELDIELASFDCENTGENELALTATDESGNSATCTAVVLVVDNLQPLIICNDFTLELDGAGEGLLTYSDILESASDNCEIVSFELSQEVFGCLETGENTVELNAEDESGNSGSCTATVTVLDLITPEMNCAPVINQQVENPGDPDVFVSVFLQGANDNCGPVEVENNITANGFDASAVYQVGGTEVIFTGTDESGNESVCTTMVNVTEDASLVVVCTDVVLELDADGVSILEAEDLDGGSFGGVGDLSFEVNGAAQVEFDCSDTGLLELWLTVSDQEGEQDSCLSEVEILDLLPPTALCQDLVLSLDEDGTAQLNASDVDAGSTDNCGVEELDINTTGFDCSDLGSNTVVLIVSDGSGNSSFCTSEVTVIDNIAPTIECPSDIVLEIPSGETEEFVELDEALATDNCTVDDIANNYNSGGADASDIYPLGVTTVVFTATDLSGNSASCQTTIEIFSVTPPADDYIIDGLVNTDFGVSVNQVEFAVSGDEDFSEFSDTDGAYDLTLNSGSSITVTPEKNTNWLDGVSTLDLILIQRHLLLLQPFISPYHHIAADINNDASVSTIDLVFLQVLILGIIDTIPNNTSWRFIPEDYVFDDPDHPLAEDFPETREYNNINSDFPDENWVAVKTGDVSGDAGLSGLRMAKPVVDFALKKEGVGSDIEYVATFRESVRMAGFQMEWELENSQPDVDRIVVQSPVLPDFGESNYHFDAESNTLRINWWNETGLSFSEGEELFRIVVSQEGSREMAAKLLSFRQRGMLWHSELYLFEGGELLTFDFNWKDAYREGAENSWQLLQNEPNPFENHTVIPFVVPEAMTVQLEILDVTGKLMKSVQINADAGMNRYYLDMSDIADGVLLYRVTSEAGDWNETRRMIKVE